MSPQEIQRISEMLSELTGRIESLEHDLGASRDAGPAPLLVATAHGQIGGRR